MILTSRSLIVILSLAFASGGTALSLLAVSTGTGSGADYGLDTNGNGAYDWLVVEANVSLPEADFWNVQATLFASSAPSGGPCGYPGVPPPVPILADGSLLPAEWPIAYAYERYFFPAGVQSVRFAFRGTDIFRTAVDGPYVVRAVLAPGDGIVYARLETFAPVPWPGDPLIEWNGTTRAYQAKDFEEPFRPAFFTGGHSDVAVNVDDDGRFDLLELRADVRVNVAGRYHLGGTLFPSSSAGGDLYRTVSYGYRDVVLDVGDASVFLRFRGDQIHASGIDGPWSFSITLSGPDEILYGYGNATPGPVPINGDGSIRLAPVYYPETLCGETAGYAASDFDDTMELARYTGAFREEPMDFDSDGRYDVLLIRAELEVYLPSGFDLLGGLRASRYGQDFATSRAQVWWPDGLVWAEFSFAGPDIRASAVDGPYLAVLSVTQIVAGIDPTTTYTTAAYRATDFDEGWSGNRSYWIESFSARVEFENSVALSTTVMRGYDLLTVVIVDTLTITVSDASGAVVRSFANRIELPSPGSTWNVLVYADGLGPGTYTCTALLGPQDKPVDVRTLTITL